jgi:hypothetical protein
MTLGEYQRLFCSLMAKLLPWAHAHGYELAFGETKRSDEQAEINAIGPSGRQLLSAFLRTYPGGVFDRLADCIDNNRGSGIRLSLHELSLAADLNAFKNKKYLEYTSEYRELGEFWESLHPLARWGGRFGDGNHFSLEYQGRK